MSAFASSGFSTSAFSILAFDFGYSGSLYGLEYGDDANFIGTVAGVSFPAVGGNIVYLVVPFDEEDDMVCALRKKLAQGSVGTGAGTLAYEVPYGYRLVIKGIDVANTTAGTLTCALHLVPDNGTANTSNMLLPYSSIAAYTLLNWTGMQVLNAGDFIQVIGSGSGLTMNISGEEEKI